jgi:hypothetical protein
MTDQVAAKKLLQELIKRTDLKNKSCCDCSVPNPQWASVRLEKSSSFACWKGLPMHSCQFCDIPLPTMRRSTSWIWCSHQVPKLLVYYSNGLQTLRRSFVRSVSMDTWQDEQIRRMQVGYFACGCIRSATDLDESWVGMGLSGNLCSPILLLIKEDTEKVRAHTIRITVGLLRNTGKRCAKIVSSISVCQPPFAARCSPCGQTLDSVASA